MCYASFNIPKPCIFSTVYLYVSYDFLQETAIMYLSSISWLARMMEVECILCRVETKFLHII